MEQQNIRDYNDETYSVSEGAALIKELNDRTRHDDNGYNSIEELGTKVKTLLQVSNIDPESMAIYFGDIGSQTIQFYINNLDVNTLDSVYGDGWENLLNDGTTYLFTAIISGDRQTYKYVGSLPITIGLGNTTVAAIDFDLVASARVVTPEDYQEKSEKGSANGYASLDSTGKVPAAQLPSYVDDVLEYADLSSFPVSGEIGKIYVALDTGFIYRWSGSSYIKLTDFVPQAGDYDLYDIEDGGFAPSNYTPVGGTDAGAQFLGVDNKLGSLDNDIANQQSEIDDKVPITGAATIYDVKTFDESPIVPTPQADLQAANRRFVLDNLGLNIENYRVLYSQSAFPTTAGFTTFGSATLAASGGELVVGTSVNAEFTHGITFNNYLTDLENIRIKVRFRIASALSPTTYGFGVGSKSTNPAGEYSYHHQFSMSSSGASGNGNTIRISNNATWTSKYAGLSQNNLLAYSTNDVIEMIAERRKEKISIITKNLTTGNVITATYKYDIATEVLPNISKVAFYMFGGTYNVQFFEISTKEVLSPEWCFIGDSKTQGLLLPKLEDGFFYKFLKDYPKSVNLSGGSERTPAVISRLAEIIALAPEKVVLNIGSNDKRDSVPVGTWSANYDSLVSSLQSAGIEVYHLLQFNETSLDFTDYNNHITSTYPKNRCIRTGTLTLHVDGIHPDAAANEIIYNAVLNFVKNS